MSRTFDRQIWWKAYLTRLATLGTEASPDEVRLAPAIAGDVAVREYRERFPDDGMDSPTLFDEPAPEEAP